MAINKKKILKWAGTWAGYLLFGAIIYMFGFTMGGNDAEREELMPHTIGGIFYDDGSWSPIELEEDTSFEDGVMGIQFIAFRKYIYCHEGGPVYHFWIEDIISGRPLTDEEVAEFNDVVERYYRDRFDVITRAEYDEMMENYTPQFVRKKMYTCPDELSERIKPHTRQPKLW